MSLAFILRSAIINRLCYGKTMSMSFTSTEIGYIKVVNPEQCDNTVQITVRVANNAVDASVTLYEECGDKHRKIRCENCMPATKSIINAIRRILRTPEAQVIVLHGMPSKRFKWFGTHLRGLSASACQAALHEHNEVQFLSERIVTHFAR